MELSSQARTISFGQLPLEAILSRASAGNFLNRAETLALLEASPDQLPEIIYAAGELRDRGKGQTITYSPKVFLPVTNLCRDHCSYCTFRKNPGDAGAWTMLPDEIREWTQRGRALGCREGLLCLGDRPETAFRQYRSFLSLLGYESTIDYVARACQEVLAAGLWPHTNAGVMTEAELALLRPFNVSMGLMLENISPRLRTRGGPHHAAPDKDPAVRLRMIEDAGRLKIPFTTGILIGIGETIAERADSLIAIRNLHERYGHIQEVIIQNFRAKPDTLMTDALEPTDVEMIQTVATARLVFGSKMNLQAPPNLSPNGHRLLLRAGINDWGGISPLTHDYVNPESPWPHVKKLTESCAREGYELRPRLPIYPEFAERDEFLDESLRGAVRAELAEFRESA